MNFNRRQKIIVEKIDKLARAITKEEWLDSIIYDLKNDTYISEEFLNEINSMEDTKTNKARSMLKKLATKDDKVIDGFIKILFKNNMESLAEEIDPKYYSTLENRSQFGNVAQVITPLPNYNVNVDRASPTEESNCSEDLKIKVIHTRNIIGHDTEIYKNFSRPRGYVFIANYNKFENNEYTERIGSEIDVKNCEELFTQMGYVVLPPKVDMNYKETITALNEFRDDKNLAEVDSVIVIIMSHGQENFFYTSNCSLEYDEVLQKFNNANCKLLQDKPKIFIFQCCRGSIADLGVEPLSCVHDNGEPEDVMMDGLKLGHTKQITNKSTLSDMFSVYAAVEGFASHRNPGTGSWLITAICKEFMENAYKKDFTALMNGVTTRISKCVSQKGRRQIPEWTSKGAMKKLYFNPRPLTEESLQ